MSPTPWGEPLGHVYELTVLPVGWHPEPEEQPSRAVITNTKLYPVKKAPTRKQWVVVRIKVPLSPVSYVFLYKLNTIVLLGEGQRIAESFVWVVVIDTTVERGICFIS